MALALVRKELQDSADEGQEPGITAIVRDGLSKARKKLPSSLLYDDRGSELFVEITQQPEYQLTNWEIDLLRTHGPDIAELFEPIYTRLYEFGAGCYSEKQEALLRALMAAEKKIIYCPIDICSTSVDNVARAVRKHFHLPLGVDPVSAEYGIAMVHIHQRRMRDGRPQFFFLPGANIGNFTTAEAIHFMRSVSNLMGSSDHFMIGFDLLKDIPQMLAAYNDAAGVTRDFNINLLTRMNNECGANFDLDAFSHHPFYDEDEGAMMSELVSMRDQVVSFSEMPGYTVSFAAGEPIAVERSRKYSMHEIGLLAERSNLVISKVFTNNLYADVVFTRSA